jgi:hypothetical protein
MCADGDADALWRGIPVHCRGGGFADAGSGRLRGGRQAAAHRVSAQFGEWAVPAGYPPVRGGPLAPCPVARSCRTEREPPIPPSFQFTDETTYTGFLV